MKIKNKFINYNFNMKSLCDFILNEGQATPEVKEKIEELKNLAKEKDLTIKFRDRKTNQGDFCIFIYHPDRRQYLVGFDGDWKSKEFNFDNCYNQAVNWIETFDSKVFFKK